MLPGINEDIVRGNRTYHVQTEDRGARNPAIVSVLFLEGAVLASERVSYEDVIDTPGADRQIKKLMIKQHRAVLRRILKGEFDEAAAAPRAEAEAEAEPLLPVKDPTRPEVDVVEIPDEDVEVVEVSEEAVVAAPAEDEEERARTVTDIPQPPPSLPEAAAAEAPAPAEEAVAASAEEEAEEEAEREAARAAWLFEDEQVGEEATGFCADVITQRPFAEVVALELARIAEQAGSPGA